MEDNRFYSSIFQIQGDQSRGCSLIVDEIYIKATLSYAGGSIFGRPVDHPDRIATTMLCIMVKCMRSKLSFMAKLLPVNALTAQFQFDCVKQVILNIESCGGRVLSIINDNNKVNQSFFKLFDRFGDDPWVVKSPANQSRPLFLLFDPVHILKNIRNNWMTEKLQTLAFKANGQCLTVKWDHLKELFKHECETTLKLSKLTKASLYPSNLEKQKVSLCLNVFSEQTSSALKTCSKSSEEWKETAAFIDSVLKLWKLWNCKSPYQSIRLNDPDRLVIDKMESGQKGLQLLDQWAEIAAAMKTATKVRMQCLTKDTADAIVWTCRSLSSLSQYLLNTDTADRHDYVALGHFQQDDIEEHFGHFRMSAGCNFYVSAREVFHTHSIDKAKLLLECQASFDTLVPGHNCPRCTAALSDGEMLLLDDLADSANVTSDEKLSIFYIAGYVASKHKELAAASGEHQSDTGNQDFFLSLNRGGLTLPSEAFFNLAYLAYAFFIKTQDLHCRRRLVNILADFPVLFHLDIEVPKTALMRLANVFLKRTCQQQHEDSSSAKSHQQKRKIMKLTSQ